MAMLDDDKIDFSALQEELEAALQQDEKYKRENDAKIRALTQGVATYDQFKDFVKASHLKPLTKTDIEKSNQRRGSLWNSINPKRKSLPDMELESHQQPLHQGSSSSSTSCDLPSTPSEFSRQWRALDIAGRLALLQRLDAPRLTELLRPEIPVGMLGELLQALLAFPANTTDIVIVVRLLQAMSQTQRFDLALQFLSTIERATCRRLMEKIAASFQDRQQDLAELGITEWTLLELRTRYHV